MGWHMIEWGGVGWGGSGGGGGGDGGGDCGGGMESRTILAILAAVFRVGVKC